MYRQLYCTYKCYYLYVYIRIIWLKVQMNFYTYCYSARQWLRVGASAWRPVIWSVCFNPMDTVLLRRNSFSRIVNAGSYTKGSGGWEPTEGNRNGSSWEILPAQVQWTIATILCGWEREARPRSRSVSGSILDNQRDRTTHHTLWRVLIPNATLNTHSK